MTSELEAANREITRLSLTDPLTLLPNRARLDQALGDNMELAVRYGNDFAVVLIDVDHFKLVNDTHGHLVGDAVLSRLGQVLAHQTRSTDIAGRWGGEEFLIVAPQTSLDKAAKLAEKLRSSIASTDFPVVGHKTISLGVAAYSPGDDLKKLLGRVDAALYLAKRSGRDRIEIGTLKKGLHNSTSSAMPAKPSQIPSEPSRSRRTAIFMIYIARPLLTAFKGAAEGAEGCSRVF